ncbi:uncharacterized protein LOC129569843 [Sitodiplosis mosellana]|uniref:uncharacterized protein LOC129569843 n=1 Tax=Sitodiplosis mosellana TaxID=263140 RepID=UPI0024452589|nr:uncharacterized protein LOC129569843 [Sitodiplosis mosellana]
MATRKSPRLNGPPAKARKENDQQDDVAVVVVTDAAVEEPTPPVFNLINDCCYAILDWLSREDLRSFGQTCKWAQQVATNFHQMNHTAMNYRVYGLGQIFGPALFDLQNTQKIHIWGMNLDPYRNVKSYCNKPIKQIRLGDTILSVAKVNCLKKLLRTVECVKLERCRINGDFYENFLKFCINIKGLHVGSSYHRNPNGDHILIGVDNGWLTRKYPTLEHLEVTRGLARRVDELKIFFEQNPNVRSFATDSTFLEENFDLFRTTKIKLDLLAIWDNSASVTAFRDNLNSLHERGVFQRLHWYCRLVSANEASLNALEKLSVGHWNLGECATISSLLVNIKELIIRFYLNGSTTMETTARNLVNLERVYLGEPTCEAIVSFIRHSAKLKKIKVAHSIGMPNSNIDGLDLAAWNKGREKLFGARKVTIYVPEHVYLATKWATNKTDYSLIELKRGNSYDWGSDFNLY